MDKPPSLPPPPSLLLPFSHCNIWHSVANLLLFSDLLLHISLVSSSLSLSFIPIEMRWEWLLINNDWELSAPSLSLPHSSLHSSIQFIPPRHTLLFVFFFSPILAYHFSILQTPPPSDLPSFPSPSIHRSLSLWLLTFLIQLICRSLKSDCLSGLILSFTASEEKWIRVVIREGRPSLSLLLFSHNGSQWDVRLQRVGYRVEWGKESHHFILLSSSVFTSHDFIRTIPTIWALFLLKIAFPHHFELIRVISWIWFISSVVTH